MGCETLAIERKYEEVGAFIESTVNGNPDFYLVNEDVFTSSMFSVEMAKTISILLKKGLVKQILYIDGDEEDTESMLAENLGKAKQRTMAIMGNWHTMRDIYDDGTYKHVSALRLLRESRAVTSLEYHYESGSYYNAGTGLDSFDDEPGELRVENSHNDFGLFLPSMQPIAH